MSKSAAESALSDLNEKLGALAEDRNLLERETAELQSQLQLEKNQVRYRQTSAIKIYQKLQCLDCNFLAQQSISSCSRN